MVPAGCRPYVTGAVDLTTAFSFNPIGGKTVSNHSPGWTRQQIRSARMAALIPLLQKRRLELIEQEAGNFELLAHPGLIVKESYWRWPERNLQGNASDFSVQVLGMSVHSVMCKSPDRKGRQTALKMAPLIASMRHQCGSLLKA